MIAELGQFCLILALMVAWVQFTLPMFGAHRNNTRLMLLADRAAGLQFLLIAIAFALLTTLFLTSDFSVKLVETHSHSAKPLLYKISGVWGNHEGSILLWVLILAAYGALVPVFGKMLPLSLRSRALAVQGLLGVGFLLFILLTSNPFERLNPMPIDGQGLNPLLQDPGLAIHPPFLYLGYVGFSMSFSFAVAALIEGRVDAIWARWLRPWVLLAWSFLTIGIAIGSFWAYYELGWGGWWMWDPVENVSFMPWLIGTALLHSIMVLGTRHTLANWTILLAIAAFSFSLIGTFIVRSGVLVSVHAFAVDPARGVAILILLALATGGSLTLYAMRAATLENGPHLPPISKGGALLMNNFLLMVATATVFLGTFYPLFIDMISRDKITVGAPYFNLTFIPIMLILIAFMGVGPVLKWRLDDLSRLKGFFTRSAVLIGVIAALNFYFGRSFWGAAGFGLSVFLIYATFSALNRKSGGNWGRFKKLPASDWGFALAHLSIAVFALGAASMGLWAKDDIARLNIGESIQLSGYTFTLENVQPGKTDNYEFLAADVAIMQKGHPVTTLQTQRRFYPVRNMVTTEAGFRLAPGQTLFAAIGEGDKDQGWILRVYSHPQVIWIWIGALMMALAGFISLFDRRLRFQGGPS